MRLFIALEIPDTAIVELEKARQRLSRGKPPVKWVAPTAYHLTLQFLGEVNSVHVPTILQALAQAEQQIASLPTLQLTSTGAFPNLNRPKTIWMGVGGDTAKLNRLQHTIVTALEPIGLNLDTRAFHAHLTLGRVRRDAQTAQLTTLGKAIAALEPPQPISWQSGPPSLFQSTRTPEGPIYTNLSN